MSYDENGNPTIIDNDISVDVNTIRNYYEADMLTEDIKSYDHNYFIVIVSCMSWERFFSSSLADKLR